MNAGRSKKEKIPTPSGGIQINAPIHANTANFANRDVVQTIYQGLSAAELKMLDEWFAPIRKDIQALPAALQPVAEKQVQELQDELGKGKESNPGRLNTLVDGLLALVPAAVSSVAVMFGQPVLAALVGPATGEILKRITGP
jgi:hypothetical protein